MSTTRTYTLLSFMMTPGEVAIVVPRFARCIASVEYTMYPLRLYFSANTYVAAGDYLYLELSVRTILTRLFGIIAT